MVLFRTRGEGRGLTNPILWSQFGVLFPVAAVTVQVYVSSSIHFPHWLYISLCIPAFVLFCFFREGAGVVLELLKVNTLRFFVTQTRSFLASLRSLWPPSQNCSMNRLQGFSRSQNHWGYLGVLFLATSQQSTKKQSPQRWGVTLLIISCLKLYT